MYIIIPAYEPDKRLIQVVQDITIKPVLLLLMMGVAQAITTITTKRLLLERLSLPILSIKEKELLSKLPLLTFKKK